MDLEEVVDELYGTDQVHFVAHRRAMAAAARREGDRHLASAIEALRRPSAAAAALNLLARRRPTDVAHLIELGDALRQAQAHLSGEEMKALGSQRRQVVAGLVAECRRVSDEAGHPVSEPVAREVEATLEAALADRGAAGALRTGRLVRALEHAGFGGVDMAGAAVGPADPGPGARHQERRRAEAQARAAEAELEQVAAHLDDASSAADEAHRRQQESDAAVRDLESRLAEARRRAETAAADAQQADRRKHAAARRLSDARHRAADARAHVGEVSGKE
jgi:hypothetical protein